MDGFRLFNNARHPAVAPAAAAIQRMGGPDLVPGRATT
jgi:hypothetical protein